MSKTSGLGMRAYVDGYDLSGDIGAIGQVGGGPRALDITGIDKSAPERVGGVRDGQLTFDTWFNPDAGQAHPVLSALPTADRYLTVVTGATLGMPAVSLLGKQIGYDGKRGQDGSFSLSVNAQSNVTGVEWGVTLTAGTRTDTAGTDGAGVDLTVVSTTFGWQAYLHALAITGTNLVVTLQDSADNAAWVDLSGGAFTSVLAGSAPTAARLVGGSTATVRRYVRAVSSGTFTSAAFVVQFVRNDTAVAF